MKLTPYEKETIILYNEAEKTASVYTHDAKPLTVTTAARQTVSVRKRRG